MGIYFWKSGVEGQAGKRVEKLFKEKAASKASLIKKVRKKELR